MDEITLLDEIWRPLLATNRSDWLRGLAGLSCAIVGSAAGIYGPSRGIDARRWVVLVAATSIASFLLVLMHGYGELRLDRKTATIRHQEAQEAAKRTLERLASLGTLAEIRTELAQILSRPDAHQPLALDEVLTAVERFCGDVLPVIPSKAELVAVQRSIEDLAERSPTRGDFTQCVLERPSRAEVEEAIQRQNASIDHQTSALESLRRDLDAKGLRHAEGYLYVGEYLAEGERWREQLLEFDDRMAPEALTADDREWIVTNGSHVRAGPSRKSLSLMRLHTGRVVRVRQLRMIERPRSTFVWARIEYRVGV